MTIGIFEIDPDTGQLQIHYGDRVVTTTNGTLVCLAPALREYSVSIEFADADGDIAYTYENDRDDVAVLEGSDIVHHWRLSQMCQSMFTRLQTDTTQTTVLDDAPAGADFFVAQLRLKRTTSPTHTWFAADVAVRPKQVAWINWNGSGLLEGAIALTRLLHPPQLRDGKLVIDHQQSVMGPAGGYRALGDIRWPEGTSREMVYSVAPGTPVWATNVSPYYKVNTITGASAFAPTGTAQQNMRMGNAAQCSTVDPTNYRSVYEVDIRGYFGRRS